MTTSSASASCTTRGPHAPCHKAERFPSGNPRRCSPAQDCSIATSIGVLKPISEPDFPRRPDIKAVEFHDTGHPARVAFELATVSTPVGELPAELALFYPDGSLRRLFPLDGHPDGVLWDEAKELHLAPTFTLPSPLGTLSARFLAISFFPSGKLRGLTLWPRERLVVKTPAGAFWVRTGISFHEDGSIESVEPHETVKVETPVGVLSAFDPHPIGLSGDQNSLAWTPAGVIQRVVTVAESFVCRADDGTEESWSPTFDTMNCDSGCGTSVALKLSFKDDRVLIEQNYRKGSYTLANVQVVRPTARGRRLNVIT
jgi:hypothetical protein